MAPDEESREKPRPLTMGRVAGLVLLAIAGIGVPVVLASRLARPQYAVPIIMGALGLVWAGFRLVRWLLGFGKVDEPE